MDSINDIEEGLSKPIKLKNKKNKKWLLNLHLK